MGGGLGVEWGGWVGGGIIRNIYIFVLAGKTFNATRMKSSSLAFF